MKKLLVTFLAAMLFTSAPVSALTLRSANEPAPAAAENGKIEGDGFATPEEAITAFAEALQEGDLDKMISTFAIESYCERYDMAGLIQRVASIQPTFLITPGYPALDQTEDFTTRLNAEDRRADLILKIERPLMMIALDRMQYDHPEYSDIAEALASMRVYADESLRTMSHSEIETVLSYLRELPDFSGMTVSAPVSPLAFEIGRAHV